MYACSCLCSQAGFPDFNVHVDHGGSRGDGQWLMRFFLPRSPLVGPKEKGGYGEDKSVDERRRAKEK